MRKTSTSQKYTLACPLNDNRQRVESLTHLRITQATTNGTTNSKCFFHFWFSWFVFKYITEEYGICFYKDEDTMRLAEKHQVTYTWGDIANAYLGLGLK